MAWQAAKEALRQAAHSAKAIASGASRVLPDFVIVGAQKAGTTSLFHYLQQHPRIATPSSKEVHYFDYNYHRGESWYRAHFQRADEKARQEEELGALVLNFEASPYYMYHPLAIERMKADLPEVKAVAMLRDPVARTYSHYWHEHNKDQDDLSLADAIEREPRRLAGEAEKIRETAGYHSYAHQHFSYVDRSRYGAQVQRLFEVLGRENVCLVKSEAFFTDPAAETERVFEFLGLPRADGIDYAPQNVGSYGDEIPPETVARLKELLAGDYALLRQLAGERFDWFE
ncbi:MAG: sulfotransferase domain-containing protein [Minwuia sp.]|uniref:sulfotransferase domain-containing protein n=1 Tax=Minwuia sp. TaxID=2493630 RepID=UPI003A848DEE